MTHQERTRKGPDVMISLFSFSEDHLALRGDGSAGEGGRERGRRRLLENEGHCGGERSAVRKVAG